jgi:hypothetical protein
MVTMQPYAGTEFLAYLTNELSAGSEARFDCGRDWAAIVYNRLNSFSVI